MRSQPIKSAARVIEVLELFTTDPRPLSLKEISTRLSYPQSSTTVLMKSLMSLGYLNYDPARRVYFPTLRVTRLGDWIPQALFGTGKIIEVTGIGERFDKTILDWIGHIGKHYRQG